MIGVYFSHVTWSPASHCHQCPKITLYLFEYPWALGFCLYRWSPQLTAFHPYSRQEEGSAKRKGKYLHMEENNFPRNPHQTLLIIHWPKLRCNLAAREFGKCGCCFFFFQLICYCLNKIGNFVNKEIEQNALCLSHSMLVLLLTLRVIF